MNKRNIVEDDPTMEVPQLHYRDYYVLNSQSAYNKHLVEEARECGCFHCGSRFTSKEITNWLKEADGDDTALCPYCGVDAVIVGTDRLPLSTALLSMLYEDWFRGEYKKANENYAYSPAFFSHSDYLRKGIPFRLEFNDRIKYVGEIAIWVPGVFFAAMNEAFDMNEPVESKGYELVDAGGIVSVKAYFNEKGHYASEIKDECGNRLPHEPFRGVDQDTVLKLTEKYGDSLKGVLGPGSGSDRMRLFVKG